MSVLGQVRAAGAAQRLVVIFILLVVLLVAAPRQECPSTSNAGEAHDESPPRAGTVDASREDSVLGTIHAIYFSTERIYNSVALPGGSTRAVWREARTLLCAEV